MLQLLLVATYLAVIQVAAVNALSSGTRREVRIPVLSAVAGCGARAARSWCRWVSGSAAPGSALAYLIAVGAGAAGPIAATWRRYEMAWAGPLIRSLVVIVVGLAVGLAAEASGVTGTGRVLADIGLAVGVAGVGAVVLHRDIRAIVTAARASASS